MIRLPPDNLSRWPLLCSAIYQTTCRKFDIMPIIAGPDGGRVVSDLDQVLISRAMQVHGITQISQDVETGVRQLLQEYGIQHPDHEAHLLLLIPALSELMERIHTHGQFLQTSLSDLPTLYIHIAAHRT